MVRGFLAIWGYRSVSTSQKIVLVWKLDFLHKIDIPGWTCFMNATTDSPAIAPSHLHQHNELHAGPHTNLPIANPSDLIGHRNKHLSQSTLMSAAKHYFFIPTRHAQPLTGVPHPSLGLVHRMVRRAPTRRDSAVTSCRARSLSGRRSGYY